jgi:PPM family protein phosphatase
MSRANGSRGDATTGSAGGSEFHGASISASAQTHVGTVRRINEDSFIARMPLYLVADGMGGHARGDRASQEAIRVFAELIDSDLPTGEFVLDAVKAANAAVRALSDVHDAGVAVAGTTLAGIVLVTTGSGGVAHWMVLNIGDSRVYSWDGRRLKQLSVDHSAVQELRDSGQISAEQAAGHPDRNIITRALGAAERVDVDVWLLPVGGAQTFLVCSDGLCKELDDDAIGAILAGDGSDAGGELLADLLVDAAVRAGGRDNVTAIVVESNAETVSMAPYETKDRPGVEQILEDTRPRG